MQRHNNASKDFKKFFIVVVLCSAGVLLLVLMRMEQFEVTSLPSFRRGMLSLSETYRSDSYRRPTEYNASTIQTFQFKPQGWRNFSYQMRGIIFKGCSDIQEVSAPVETSTIFEFSPTLNNHFKQMFAEHSANEIWHDGQLEPLPMQVSCASVKELLTCCFRVWLRSGAWASKGVKNRYQDNFLYTIQLDSDLNVVPKSAKLLGIPSPVQETGATGPEDPRLFMINETIFTQFINWHDQQPHGGVRRQFLWSMDNSVLYTVKADKLAFHPMEKNWAPWVRNDTLYFVYQFMPDMRLMKCELIKAQHYIADCKFLFGKDGNIDTNGINIRGGSPIVHYQGDYFVTLTHTLRSKYAAQIVLINGKNYRVVFISTPLLVDPKWMLTVPISDVGLGGPCLYARSVFVETLDSLVFATGVNDFLPLLVRVTGVAEMLKKAIEADSALQQQCNEKQLAATLTAMDNWVPGANGQELAKFFGAQMPPKAV